MKTSTRRKESIAIIFFLGKANAEFHREIQFKAQTPHPSPFLYYNSTRYAKFLPQGNRMGHRDKPYVKFDDLASKDRSELCNRHIPNTIHCRHNGSIQMGINHTENEVRYNQYSARTETKNKTVQENRGYISEIFYLVSIILSKTHARHCI